MINDITNEEGVSVVIVNYNSGLFLEECIRAVMPQVSEVIVVDNASTDLSLKICVNKFPNEPKFKVIKNERNIGFSAACNVGMRDSTGDFIFFLNPDCRIEERGVARLLECVRLCDRTGMVGGLLLNPDGSEQAGGRRKTPTPASSFSRAFGLSYFLPDFDLNETPLPSHPVEVPAISGACMLVKREAIEDVGLWDEGYFLHCEDLDWCMRFRNSGWKILFVPDARIVHQKGVCSKSRPIFVEWHKHKGMSRFYHKFYADQFPRVFMCFVTLGVWIRFLLVMILYITKRFFHALVVR